MTPGEARETARGELRVPVGGRSVEVSHPGKILYPGIGLTKRDLAGYAVRVAKVMIPHLEGRALTVERYPDGIMGKGFFQKRCPPGLPAWFERARLPLAGGGTITQMVVRSPEALVYLVNLGAIVFHIPLGRIESPRRADRMIFDLDPPGKGSFPEVRKVAFRLRRFLEDVLGVSPRILLTGSSGVHLHVPLSGAARFDRVREVAAEVAAALGRRHPDLVTISTRRAGRRERIYVDVGRNAFGQASIAPYSPRALPGAPVAVPMTWPQFEHVAHGADRYSVGNIFRRLGQVGDPWAGERGPRLRLDDAERRLAESARK